VTLAIEALLLVVASRFPPIVSLPYAGLALLAGAMGIQTATLTGIGPLTVHTTFVTGMLNKIAQLVSHITFRGYDLLKANHPDSSARRAQKRDIEMALFLILIWLFYVAGAAGGTFAFALWGFRTLNIAVALLAVGFVTDQLSPLSIREEKEQSER